MKPLWIDLHKPQLTLSGWGEGEGANHNTPHKTSEKLQCPES